MASSSCQRPGGGTSLCGLPAAKFPGPPALRLLFPATLPQNFLAAFFQAGKKLLRSPAAAISGIGCGFLVQLALSGVFALNLLAIAKAPLPWASLGWTFPLIVIAGGIPVTVVGFGTREGAAIGLLGLYGISAADAVAMSLLSVSVNLF